MNIYETLDQIRRVALSHRRQLRDSSCSVKGEYCIAKLSTRAARLHDSAVEVLAWGRGRGGICPSAFDGMDKRWTSADSLKITACCNNLSNHRQYYHYTHTVYMQSLSHDSQGNSGWDARALALVLAGGGHGQGQRCLATQPQRPTNS
jgi:hypothetical protein